MEESKEKAHQSSKRKGGLRTMPFIVANETFEKVASMGLMANMIVYLTTEYHISLATGTSILFIWAAVSSFLPIFGAFLSDSYLGRFRIIALGCVLSLMGMILLWLTALLPGARPDSCKYPSPECKSPTPSQTALLFSSFALMSLGAGGIRPCSLAFGADQMDRPHNPKNAWVMQRFFNWYYASIGISTIIAATVIVYIQDNQGWQVGFGVPVILMFLSSLLFFLGSPIYVKLKASKSMLTELFQAMSAAIKSRRLVFPAADVELRYHHTKGSHLVAPTDKLRFLNKACIIRNSETDLRNDGTASDPWKLCTVERVEDLKSIIKLIPIWSTGMLTATISQHSFPVYQAMTMDRHLGPKFQIPAGSYGVFATLTFTVWVTIYDGIVVPLLARITGNPRGIGHKQRMGMGLLLTCAATAVSAIVENARRSTAIRQGFLENGQAVVDMSAMWLVPQYCLIGFAEAFSIIGQIEFYYSELPKTMSSVGVGLLSLVVCFGSLVGSLIVEILDEATKNSANGSWVSDNPSKAHYDYYYWILYILSLLNFIYFLFCARIYGPCKEDLPRVSDVEEGDKGYEDISNSRELDMLM